MSYEIHLDIAEDSERGHLIASLSAEQHISPSQAVERIIDQAAKREVRVSLVPEGEETPTELVARLRAQKAAKGEGPQAPLRTNGADKIIGLFADAPELVESILDVVDARGQRFASRT